MAEAAIKAVFDVLADRLIEAGDQARNISEGQESLVAGLLVIGGFDLDHERIDPLRGLAACMEHEAIERFDRPSDEPCLFACEAALHPLVLHDQRVLVLPVCSQHVLDPGCE